MWQHVRLGRCGDPTWTGQPGGWKPANGGNSVKHTIEEMNKWIAKDALLMGNTRQLEAPDGHDKDGAPDKTILEDDGVEAQMERGESEDLADLVDQSQEDVEV